MPRKKTVSLQRRLSPDRKYQSVLVQRLINKSMLDGKKLVAERAVYAALESAAKKLDSENPLEVFERALKNVSPNFEVKSRRVVVRTTRSHSLLLATVSCTTRLAGWSRAHVRDRVCHTSSVWRLRSSMPTTKPVQPSRRRKTLTRWPKPTVRLRTLLGDNKEREAL